MKNELRRIGCGLAFWVAVSVVISGCEGGDDSSEESTPPVAEQEQEEDDATDDTPAPPPEIASLAINFSTSATQNGDTFDVVITAKVSNATPGTFVGVNALSEIWSGTVGDSGNMTLTQTLTGVQPNTTATIQASAQLDTDGDGSYDDVQNYEESLELTGSLE